MAGDHLLMWCAMNKQFVYHEYLFPKTHVEMWCVDAPSFLRDAYDRLCAEKVTPAASLLRYQCQEGR